MELLQNAWMGWANYINEGKLIVLLLAALLLLWINKRGTEHKGLVLYSTVAAVSCICPLTGALLMNYQTKFYDYEWIWSIVPITAVIACAVSLFLTEYWSGGKFSKIRMGVVVTLMCLVVVFFCGSMGGELSDGEAVYMEVLYPYGSDVSEADLRQQAYNVVECLEEAAGDGEIILWAPMEIVEYAREVNADIKLLYGRNMWDISLNGYSYDVYEEEVKSLYLWMEQVDAPAGESVKLPFQTTARLPLVKECITAAVVRGVNCVVLPGGCSYEVVQVAEETLGAKAQLVEEYWVIYGQTD